MCLHHIMRLNSYLVFVKHGAVKIEHIYEEIVVCLTLVRTEIMTFLRQMDIAHGIFLPRYAADKDTPNLARKPSSRRRH